jgi:hypothetical protein
VVVQPLVSDAVSIIRIAAAEIEELHRIDPAAPVAS